MLVVPSLNSFDESDWDSLTHTFQHAPCLVTGQVWLPQPRENFRPAEIRVGWRDDAIHVLAELEDDDVFTDATDHNQPMWQLGDVLEIFLRDAEREDYVELHTTPPGYRWQLRFPSGKEIYEVREEKRAASEFVIQEPLFTFRTRLRTGGWSVFASIPYQAVHPGVTSPAGRSMAASFCRYDYTRGGGDPVISSTSPYTAEDFHRLAEWSELRFTP